MNDYRAPTWMPRGHGWAGHVQTIWPALASKRTRGGSIHYQRQRIGTPDGDFIDFDWLRARAAPAAEPEGKRPLLVMFHGLEGSSRSHYALAFADRARHRGWDFVMPHFRGCSGEMNWAPRAYHSGDHQEIGWMLQQCRERHSGPLVAVGVSLGGNALLRWAQEAMDPLAMADAVVAISSPIDMNAGGQAIGQGWNRRIYTRMFLQSMKPRARAKWRQHPGLFDLKALEKVTDLHGFDAIFTAPLHGFASTQDYWTRASAKPGLRYMRLPSLVINARNDPFLPAQALPQAGDVADCVTLWQPLDGGHVGFPSGPFPGHVLDLPERVMDWLSVQGGLRSLGPQSPKVKPHG